MICQKILNSQHLSKYVMNSIHPIQDVNIHVLTSAHSNWYAMHTRRSGILGKLLQID